MSTHTNYCENCHKPFTSKRNDAKCCSPTCRTQLRRKKQSYRDAAHTIKANLQFLINYEHELTGYEKAILQEARQKIEYYFA